MMEWFPLLIKAVCVSGAVTVALFMLDAIFEDFFPEAKDGRAVQKSIDIMLVVVAILFSAFILSIAVFGPGLVCSECLSC